MREADVLRSILDYLAAKRVLAFRMNTGALKVDKRFMRFGVPGMADILAFPDDSPLQSVLWIECKADKGVQSELQKSFAAQVKQAGHTYIIARSIDDVAPYL
jgi:hypothetical protein